MLVINFRGEKHRLQGRVAALITHLLEMREDVNKYERVRVEYNCAGRVIRPTIEIHPKDITVES